MKTHTFRNRKYKVEIVQSIDGLCDTFEDEEGLPTIMIINNEGLRGLNSAIHEALHASGIPTEHIHKDNEVWDVARFLWRLGWRKT